MGKEVHCYSAPDYASAALAAAVEDIFAQSAAARALGPRSRVLVKPNLVAKHAPEKAVTTHPAVLDAVCAALRRRGVESITVADSPGGLYNPAVMKSIYKASGLLAVCERHGALAYTACEAAPRKTDGVRVKEFSLLRPVLEADFIIDLPKVKTHVMTGMSCAVKNLFGTVPGLQKAEFHMRFTEKEPFGEMLVDLCETVRPQLIIADGVLAMEGDGPAGGTPRALGLVLGGEDAYAVDLAVCRLMGMPAMRVPYLAAAHARGHEDHVGIADGVLDRADAFLRRIAAHVGIGPGSKPFGQLLADLELDFSLGAKQSLRIRIGADEGDTLQARHDHVLHGIAAATADTDDLYIRGGCIRFKLHIHHSSSSKRTTC